MPEKIALAGTGTTGDSPLVDTPLNGAATSNAAANREAGAAAQGPATATPRAPPLLPANLVHSPPLRALSGRHLLPLGLAPPLLLR